MTKARAIVTPVKRRRLSLGLSQKELADRCIDAGVKTDDSHISKIERGRCMPYPRLRKVLADILDLDPVDLSEPKAAARS